MFLYHESHPYEYIFIPCFIYAIIFTCLAPWIKKRKYNFIYIIFFILLSVIISSPLGGLLWEYHDMKAGFFPEGKLLTDKLLEGFTLGISIGWIIIAMSIPYNIFCLIAGYVIIKTGIDRFS
jgi:hypothetical protein